MNKKYRKHRAEDVQINLRVARVLRDAFRLACERQSLPTSTVMRQLMQSYITATTGGSHAED